MFLSPTFTHGMCFNTTESPKKIPLFSYQNHDFPVFLLGIVNCASFFETPKKTSNIWDSTWSPPQPTRHLVSAIRSKELTTKTSHLGSAHSSTVDMTNSDYVTSWGASNTTISGIFCDIEASSYSLVPSKVWLLIYRTKKGEEFSVPPKNVASPFHFGSCNLCFFTRNIDNWGLDRLVPR